MFFFVVVAAAGDDDVSNHHHHHHYHQMGVSAVGVVGLVPTVVGMLPYHAALN